MKNLICTAFSFKEGYETSTQTGKKASLDTTEMYMKNIYVSLTSAKVHNPDADVALFVNRPVSEQWEAKLTQNDISVRVCPFDEYAVPKEFRWALAFYKLCVLDHIVSSHDLFDNYGHVLLMDNDTYTTGPYDDLWSEADMGVLLYNVGHSFSHKDREVIRQDFLKFFEKEAKERAITHYGGELVAGSMAHLRDFMGTCRKVFDTMTKDPHLSMDKLAGDETVWSVAAAVTDVPVINACPYIFRFWTEKFYLVSTVTVSNPVCIWHLPSEKNTGFIRMYGYYNRHLSFPSVDASSRIFGLMAARRPFSLGSFFFRLRKKIWKILRK